MYEYLKLIALIFMHEIVKDDDHLDFSKMPMHVPRIKVIMSVKVENASMPSNFHPPRTPRDAMRIMSREPNHMMITRSLLENLSPPSINSSPRFCDQSLNLRLLRLQIVTNPA